MLGWSKKIAIIILLLPVILLVFHDVIPHHHHYDGIQGIVCSNHEFPGCEEEHHTDNNPCESHQPFDIQDCGACHFTYEFVIDNTHFRLLSINSNGIKSGKYAFECPVFLNIPSRMDCIFSQMA